MIGAGGNFSFPEHNSATVRNTLMVLGKLIEQISANCRMAYRVSTVHDIYKHNH